jgi:hypothetical protein
VDTSGSTAVAALGLVAVAILAYLPSSDFYLYGTLWCQ